ncbi:hypothetical protein BDZ88DRAFT_146177 [Geranomyces variabilis]|nr:hypothetical protein BDZ88DRAFT_146177 [Geranomyces variabilis]
MKLSKCQLPHNPVSRRTTAMLLHAVPSPTHTLLRQGLPASRCISRACVSFTCRSRLRCSNFGCLLLCAVTHALLLCLRFTSGGGRRLLRGGRSGSISLRCIGGGCVCGFGGCRSCGRGLALFRRRRGYWRGCFCWCSCSGGGSGRQQRGYGEARCLFVCFTG